jgi:hypothetical protein
MSAAEQDVTATEVPFSLAVDQYERLWLHAKLDGFPVTIELADKEALSASWRRRWTNAGSSTRLFRSMS